MQKDGLVRRWPESPAMALTGDHRRRSRACNSSCIRIRAAARIRTSWTSHSLAQRWHEPSWTPRSLAPGAPRTSWTPPKQVDGVPQGGSSCSLRPSGGATWGSSCSLRPSADVTRGPKSRSPDQTEHRGVELRPGGAERRVSRKDPHGDRRSLARARNVACSRLRLARGKKRHKPAGSVQSALPISD